MSEFYITEEIVRFFLYGKKNININSEWREKMYRNIVPGNLPVPHQVVVAKSGLPGCTYGVYAISWIRSGTEMGPYAGAVVPTQSMLHQNRNLWEVFDKFGNISHFIDGGNDQSPASWLTCVQCARSEEEQNLEVVQIGSDIYYRAVKDIAPEEELLVWYGASSYMYMGIPFTVIHDQGRQKPGTGADNSNPTKQQPSIQPDLHISKLRCVLCRRGFNSRSNLRSHMRIHTMEKPFCCRFCSRRFSQSSTLRNHIRLHTGEKPYKCVVCKSSYSQLAGLRAHQRSARHKPHASETTSRE